MKSLLLAAGLLIGMMIGYRDPMLQRNFPCHEDEALMFHPTFGSERVGCVHIELIVTEIAPTLPPQELR